LATELRIPKAGQAMEEGTIAKWLVADGDSVEQGQPVYRLETDKVEMDIEAPVSGVIRITAPEGSTHGVGTPVAEIEG
jgi:pyruvate/2-oxoglutarate dehydrogenase complex dihydrolipoamide acyltransferase (E2) component